MSGPICPDCGGFSVRQDYECKTAECPFCGWKGSLLPRKALRIEDQRKWSQRNFEKERLRKQGKLFFCRIYTAEGFDVLSLMQALGVKTMKSPRGDPPYVYLEFDHEPSKGELDKIRALPGVQRIVIS